jgi:hypothetical protein
VVHKPVVERVLRVLKMELSTKVVIHLLIRQVLVMLVVVLVIMVVVVHQNRVTGRVVVLLMQPI